MKHDIVKVTRKLLC